MVRRFRYKDLQLPQLRSFCVAATQGNFTAAAQLLGLSAPTVWEQVRGLERRIGATLLIRRGRTVELTPEGRVLLKLVQPHVSGLDSLERLFAGQRGVLPRPLTIASTPYLLAYHLVQPIQGFVREHSATVVNLRPIVRLEEGMRAIERGQADLGVLPYCKDEAHSADLEFERLFDLHFALLSAADHPLARKKKVGPHDIIEYPLIVQPEGTRSRLTLDRVLRRHELHERVHVAMESSHFDVICSYVASGIGIALLYAGIDGNKSLPGIYARVFDQKMEGLPVAIVSRKAAHLSEPAEAFRAAVRSLFRPEEP